MCTPWFLFKNILIHFWIYIAAISVASSAQVFCALLQASSVLLYIYILIHTHRKTENTKKHQSKKQQKPPLHLSESNLQVNLKTGWVLIKQGLTIDLNTQWLNF